MAYAGSPNLLHHKAIPHQALVKPLYRNVDLPGSEARIEKTTKLCSEVARRSTREFRELGKVSPKVSLADGGSAHLLELCIHCQ